MKAKIIAPYSNHFGKDAEIVDIAFGFITSPSLAKVKVDDKILTYTLDELETSKEDKEKLSDQFKAHIRKSI